MKLYCFIPKKENFIIKKYLKTFNVNKDKEMSIEIFFGL